MCKVPPLIVVIALSTFNQLHGIIAAVSKRESGHVQSVTSITIASLQLSKTDDCKHMSVVLPAPHVPFHNEQQLTLGFGIYVFVRAGYICHWEPDDTVGCKVSE